MRRLFLLFLASAALSSAALRDYSGVVTTQIDKMTTSFSPVFLTEGTHVFNSIAVVMLVILGLRVARSSLAAHHLVLPLDEMIHFTFLFLLGETMLRFWDRPLPMLGGETVHGIIPHIGQDLASKIDISSLDLLTGQVDKILAGTTMPSPLQIGQIGVYFELTGLLCLISGILFILTLLSFVAIGLGTLVGPLMVPMILIPRFSWIFYNWISYTVKYSFYQVIANGLVFIWANAFVYVITSLFGGVVDLAKASTEILALVLLSAGMLASIWYVTHWVNDLFTGSSHAGGSLAGVVKGSVMKAFQ